MLNTVLARVLRVGLSRQAQRALDETRPSGIPQVHAVGPDADRILLVIDRPSAGEGFLSQELGFAGHLARQLSVFSGCGTDLDILSNGNLTAAECALALASLDLARFDTVVLMVGLSEALALTSSARWGAELSMLLDDIEDTSPNSVHTFVVAVPPVRALINFPKAFAPLVQATVRRLNAKTAAVAAGRERVTVLPFDLPAAATDGRNSSADFKGWAALIAPSIHARQLELGGPRRPSEEANEPARQLSLDDLHVIDSSPSPRIDRLVASARNLFGADGAAVTFLDHDRRWVKSAVGTSTADSPRVGSLCDLAIAQAGIFVIEDTRADPHIGTHYPNDAVCFYAGFPLEAPSGRRIGVLCILDSEPRTFRSNDGALLRELALQVQAELWTEDGRLEA
jgi:GAF domain